MCDLTALTAVLGSNAARSSQCGRDKCLVGKWPARRVNIPPQNAFNHIAPAWMSQTISGTLAILQVN